MCESWLTLSSSITFVFLSQFLSIENGTVYLFIVIMRILKVLYLFPMVVVTNYHKLGGLKKHYIFSASGDENSKISVLARTRSL